MLVTGQSGVFTFSDDVTRQCRDVMTTGQSVSRPCVAAGDSKLSAISKGDRYKTELCRTFEENGLCRYGDKCQFAHGATEVRDVNRHPKYKTDLCRTFHTTGFCPYGARCHFIHGQCENSQTRVPVTSSSPLPQTLLCETVRPLRENSAGPRPTTLDDDLLIALVSLLQRHSVQPSSALVDNGRGNFGVVDSFRSASSCSLSPCPSPGSVFGSGGGSDSMLSSPTSPPVSSHVVFQCRRPAPSDCSSSYSSCGSPDSLSYIGNWAVQCHDHLIPPPPSCFPSSTLARSHQPRSTAHSIFA